MSEQRVFGPGTHKGKEYTSTGTTVKRLIIFGVIVAILAIIYFAVAPLNHAIRLMYEQPSGGEQYAVLTPSGLTLAGTKEKVAISGTGKDSYAVISGDYLVVCNRQTMAVGFVAPDGKIAWHDVPTVFGESDQILRLFPAAEGVNVVVQDLSDTAKVRAASRPTGTILVRFNGSTDPISNDQAIEPSMTGGITVSRTNDGRFSWNEGGQATSLAVLPDAVFWDTDFDSKLVAAAEDKSVVLINNGRKIGFTPATGHKVTDIRVRPDLKEVWVAVAKMGGGTGVLAYDYNGGFKAIRANSKEIMYGPFAPKCKSVEALLASAQ
jgi:hypothetical protein